MKIAVLLVMAVALSACNEKVDKITWGTDQCLRAELFKTCLNNTPQGPQSAKYNDWDEVVSTCDNSAYYQSRRMVEHIKPECRGS